MKQFTTIENFDPAILIRTKTRLQAILIKEDHKAIRAAEQLAFLLRAIAETLPDTERAQIEEIVSLYDQCCYPLEQGEGEQK